MNRTFPLVAVDIGNSRIKFGFYPSEASTQPSSTLSLRHGPADGSDLQGWLTEHLPPDAAASEVPWYIASVNRPATTELVETIRSFSPSPRCTLLTSADVPIEIALPKPDMVGVDRLLSASGAELYRHGGPAVVVDLGTAITVDLVDDSGSFRGGAILPGIGMSARALHEFTDLLPLIHMDQLTQAPEPVGSDTVPAMESGLFWGAVGGIRELITRYTALCERKPTILLTGGAAPSVAGLLSESAVYAPHLTLEGIFLAATAKRVG